MQNKKAQGLATLTSAGRMDVFIDFILVILVTAFAFGVAYHPYFFGDELPAHRLAIKSGYSFWAIFQGFNQYRPRLINNGIVAFLTSSQAERIVYVALIVSFMAFINILLYSVVRYMFRSDRILAWMLIATTLTSRFAMPFYFDYMSGLYEMSGTTLFLITLLLSWKAWHGTFKWRYAAGALVAAILCIFSLDRLVAGLLAAGSAIAIGECIGSSAKRRISVVAWALSLGIVPLFLFWIAITVTGSLPMTTGTSGQLVVPGRETILCMITYCYNVFLGGNYGHEWFWGLYNFHHPIGKILGWGTVTCTIIMTVVIVWKRYFETQTIKLMLGILAIALALIVVASLPGPNWQDARWMFPVGILVSILWITAVKHIWRHIAIGLILATNLVYLLLGNQYYIVTASSSRAASCIAGSMRGIMPNGRNGIVVGFNDNLWIIGGGEMVDMGTRKGDTFSKVNLPSGIHIDPFPVGRKFDPTPYDFGLAFDGFGPNHTSRYRFVSVGTAMIIAGISNIDSLPVKTVLGSGENWPSWRGITKSDQNAGAILLRPGRDSWCPVPVANLDGHWLVYTARSMSDTKVPMRLQVNWHAKEGDQFLTATIIVVYPGRTWQSFATLLNAPPGADNGLVYATLHDGAQGMVELKSVVLK